MVSPVRLRRMKSAIARLVDNLNVIPKLFPPLKVIAIEVAPLWG
jgi:hypothetical protein